MIEWTTPTQLIRIKNTDITNCDVYVTIAQGDFLQTMRPDEMTFDGTCTLLTVTLDQTETGALEAGNAKLQVNAIDSDGYRAATQQVLIKVGSNLLDREVSYGD